MLEPTSKEASTKSYKRTKKTSKKIKAATWANQKAPRGSAEPQQRGAEHETAAWVAKIPPRGGLAQEQRRADVSGGG